MRYKLDNVNIGEYLYFIIILIYDWESLGLNNKDQRKVKLYIYIGYKIRDTSNYKCITSGKLR